MEWRVDDGRHEIDQFDDDHARYLILLSDDGRHLTSARLLPTNRPHVLGMLFANLCERTPPRGPDIAEITRFCLDRSLRAIDRSQVRDQLVTAIVEHAVESGTATLTVSSRWAGCARIGYVSSLCSQIAERCGMRKGTIDPFHAWPELGNWPPRYMVRTS